MSGAVLDPTAVVALLTDEPGAKGLREALEMRTERIMSASSLVELGLVMEARYGAVGGGLIERFLRDAEVDIVPFDRGQADRALEGWRRFGKGRHPAGLNLGDCYSYGLAVTTGYPICCVGDDFVATDVEVVPERQGPR